MLYCFMRKELVLYCFQEERSVALLLSGEEKWRSSVYRRRDLLLYCSQEKKTGALLLSRRRKLVLYCSQEKETGLLLFSGEGIWCTSILKEKETDALLLMFSGEEDWCSTVLRRRAIRLYCTLKKGIGAVPSLLVNSDGSRQLVLVKFAKTFGFCFEQKMIAFIAFI